MQRAAALAHFKCPDLPDITVETIRWPVSTVRVSGHDTAQLLAFAERVLSTWRGYSDPEADVLAYTEESGTATPHNTITPILRYDAKRVTFSIWCRATTAPQRNTRKVFFHPHREIHHIKKENIGLIEVMGLAILPPGRWKNSRLRLRLCSPAKPTRQKPRENAGSC